MHPGAREHSAAPSANVRPFRRTASLQVRGVLKLWRSQLAAVSTCLRRGIMLKLTSLKTAALVSVTAVATTFLIQACGGGGAVAQSASDADVIEGVWDTTVTNKDCSGGAVLGQPSACPTES